MKRKWIWSAVLGAALLCGCAASASSPAPSVTMPENTDAPSHAAAPAREQSAEMKVMLEGMEETVPVELFTAEGWSVYIPAEDWTHEREYIYGLLPEDRWKSVWNDAVELRVRAYEGFDAGTARQYFLEEEETYLFEDMMGGGWLDPLVGYDDKAQTCLAVMTAEANGTAYVLAWKYPLEAAEGFGVRLYDMAETFEPFPVG